MGDSFTGNVVREFYRTADLCHVKADRPHKDTGGRIRIRQVEGFTNPQAEGLEPCRVFIRGLSGLPSVLLQPSPAELWLRRPWLYVA